MGTIGDGSMGDLCARSGVFAVGAGYATRVVADPVPNEDEGCGDEWLTTGV